MPKGSQSRKHPADALGGDLWKVCAFAEPSFPPPRFSVYEERQHPWALTAAQLPLEHQF